MVTKSNQLLKSNGQSYNLREKKLKNFLKKIDK